MSSRTLEIENSRVLILKMNRIETQPTSVLILLQFCIEHYWQK